MEKSKISFEKDNCRICGKKELKEYISFGDMPLPNNLFKTQEEALNCNKFLLKVNYCNNCSLSQLSEVVDPKVLFSHYVYKSGVSHGYINHCKEMANTFKDKYTLVENSSGDFMIDIAGNDCTLLEQFKEKYPRLRLLNIDPAKNLCAICREKGIPAIDEFLTLNTAMGVVKGYGLAQVITATNVTAHVDKLREFFLSAKFMLAYNGVFIIEFPYLVDTINNLSFGQVYHEHLSYFLITPLNKLAEECDMKIVDVKKFDIHDGTCRVVITHNYSNREVLPSVSTFIDGEKELGFTDFKIYNEWSNLVKDNLVSLNFEISNLISQRFKIGGFGACHDSKTKLVTQDGIKAIEEVTKEDKVFTINTKTGNIEISDINEILKFQYNGEMINFFGNRVSQLVTPNHKILYQKGTKNKFIFENAEKVSKKAKFKLPIGNWIGKDEEFFNINQFVDQSKYNNYCRKIQEIFATEDFLYLLGIFIGDGYTCGRKDQGFSINLCIPKQDKARVRLKTTLEKMNLSYREYDKEIQIASKALYEICLQCGLDALHKTIPIWALDYSPKYLEKLLLGLVDSDGYYREESSRYKKHTTMKGFCTSSEKLAKDVVELCIKLGISPSITHRKTGKNSKIKGREIKASQGYTINIAKTQITCLNNKKENYNGEIWCLSVNNKNFLIEREGKICFSGNSAKGNTMLNAAGLSYKDIMYIVDDTHEKQGMYSPGTGIPIVSVEELKNNSVDYLLILAPNFTKEIKKRLEGVYTGKYIIPVPNVIIE